MAPNRCWKEKVFLERKKKTFLFLSKNRDYFLFQADGGLRARPPRSHFSLPCELCGGCTPRPHAWPGFLRSPAPPGLTVLSSFPVKADGAQSPCVDAAQDTLGTADTPLGRPLLHGSCPLPLQTLCLLEVLDAPGKGWRPPGPPGPDSDWKLTSQPLRGAPAPL